MEDQTNGYIYEIASPVELVAAGHRGPGPHCPAPQGRPRDGPSGAGGSRTNPEPGPVERWTAAATD